MTAFRILLLIFLLVPLVEIYVLIEVGEVIGTITTVFLVVFTAVLGAQLIRFQGLTTFRRVQASVARGEVPALEMFEGVILLVSGALLLTPGFVTDAFGFLCLIPPIRRWFILSVLKRHFVVPSSSAPREPERDHGPRTLEGEFQREDDEKRR